MAGVPGQQGATVRCTTRGEGRGDAGRPEDRRRSGAGCRGRGRARCRARLVARRRHLPDLPAFLRGFRRRRHGRPAGHHRAPRPCGIARGRRDLGVTVLQVADGRFRLRRQRLPRGRSDLRDARRFRPPRRGGAPPRAARDHRPGHEPHLGPAPLVPGEPAEPRQPARRLVCVGGPSTRRHAAQQLAVHLRRLRLAVGAAARPVLPA